MRVQIHLNLSHPEHAENVVRIQSPRGAWVGVAYATHVVLDNCVPVVDDTVRQKINQGVIGKKPHAFLEGDLVECWGRLRDKAPRGLQEQFAPHLTPRIDFQPQIALAQAEGLRINYNPRFANCFYLDQPQRSDISQRLIQAQRLVAVGWRFWGQGCTTTPLLLNDLCDQSAMDLTTNFEKLAMRKGKVQTDLLLEQHSKPRKHPMGI